LKFSDENKPLFQQAKMKQKIWTFSFAFEHHGSFSAFHRLADYLPEEIRKVQVTFPWTRFMPKPLRNRMRVFYLVSAEKRLIRQASQAQPRLIHFFYPENCFFTGPFPKNFKGKTLLTLHQPQSVLPSFKTSFQGKSFLETAKNAGLLIALSPHVVRAYRAAFLNPRIQVIPHGVDTNFFRPQKKEKRFPLILTVGNWMRDFNLWAQVAENFLKNERAEKFCLITNPENIRRFQIQKTRNTIFYHGVKDQEIRDLYNQADCIFLPLLDAVANNALLEALAVNRRVLVTDLPATKYYGSNRVWYFDKKAGPDAAASALTDLLNKKINKKKKVSSLEYAKSNFSWVKISNLYLKTYDSLLKK